MRIQVIVQHHASRADILPRLLDRLPESTLVVTDPGGERSSPWRCQRLCLTSGGDASHIVVIQDDALPCVGFYQAAAAAISARPTAAVAFCVTPQARVTSHEMTIALKARQSWARWSPRDFWPLVCSSYPTAMAEEMQLWVDERKPDSRNDDSVTADFLRARRYEAWVTVPSLVQHGDDVPSLIGRKHMSGLNPGRLAKWWIGDGDPRAISWDLP